MDMTLPLPPNVANARMHWAVKHRKQSDYRLRCTAAHMERPAVPIAPARLTARFFLHNRMDEDNLTARLKWAQDWLVDRQIILDDHLDALTLGSVTQAIDRKNMRLELTVEEA